VCQRCIILLPFQPVSSADTDSTIFTWLFTSESYGGAGCSYDPRPGDSFRSIALAFGITEASLRAANPGVGPSELEWGWTVDLPSEDACAGGRMHVQVGDHSVSQGLAEALGFPHKNMQCVTLASLIVRLHLLDVLGRGWLCLESSAWLLSWR
jgi:hypothetical protein